MIRNYFTIALRNLGRYKLVSSINLLGLSVGISCCLLIMLYVVNELSYDKHFKNSEKTYRLTRTFLNNDGVVSLHLSALAPAFGPRLKTDFPQIESMTRILSNGATVVKNGEKLFTEEDAFFADENFFDFFSTGSLRGDPKTLKDPANIFLSEEVAAKYFGNEDPINKTVRVDNITTYKVTGTFPAFPANSHFHPRVLLSFNTLKDSAVYGERRLNESFSSNSFYTYVKLKDDATAQHLQSLFPAFIDKHMGPKGKASFKVSDYTQLFIQKLSDIHLHSQLDSELEANGDIKRVYIFSCIAIFILLIACINYVNLSTARSVIRSKEIGIRKAIGAKRKELIFQFLSESVVITAIATIIAVILAAFMVPLINKLSGQSLMISLLFDWRTLLVLFILPFFLGILSGIYPALFMSGFNTIKVLKGFFRMESSGVSFRKILVVSQFAISIILIIATIVVFRQLDFMQNTPLGFEKEKVLTLFYNQGLNTNYEGFRTELLKNSSIQAAGRSSRIPTDRLLDDLGSVRIASGDTMVPVLEADLKLVRIDHHFINSFGITMAAGRNFSEKFKTDTTNFILNEAGARNIGFKNPGEAVGKVISYGGVKGSVIGVTKDFHFESLHEKIVPIIFAHGGRTLYGYISLRTTNLKRAITALEKTWPEYLPDVPLQYTFMDENVANLYESELQQSRVFTGFAFIAIFIACLGLFGLSAFTISQRIKEIGIRKVLGATMSQIVNLLSVDFLKLVIIAALIGIPLAWQMMNYWLQDFAYRINIPLWALILSPAVALIIAFLTIGSQAVKAATENPVKSLRTE